MPVIIPPNLSDQQYLYLLVQGFADGSFPGASDSISSSFQAQPSLTSLLELPTAGSPSVGTLTYGVLNGTILQFYTLMTGNSGSQPADYNASTNNVSWVQTL